MGAVSTGIGSGNGMGVSDTTGVGSGVGFDSDARSIPTDSPNRAPRNAPAIEAANTATPAVTATFRWDATRSSHEHAQTTGFPQVHGSQSQEAPQSHPSLHLQLSLPEHALFAGGTSVARTSAGVGSSTAMPGGLSVQEQSDIRSIGTGSGA